MEGNFVTGTFSAFFHRDGITRNGTKCVGRETCEKGFSLKAWCGHESVFNFMEDETWLETNTESGQNLVWRRDPQPRKSLAECRCVVVYIGGEWEKDFLFQELIPEGYPVVCDHLRTRDLDIESVAGVLERLSTRLPVVLAFSSNLYSYEAVVSYADKLGARAVVHMSDEWGNNPEYYGLAERYGYFRQYYHPRYGQLQGTVIPLGHVSGTNVWDGAKAASTRPMKWGFVGSVKADRQDMLRSMQTLMPYLWLTNVSRDRVGETYRKCVFAPWGRGNVSLNCFRLYEATACGALPVIVGKRQEVDALLESQGFPPWLVFGTWAEAAKACKALLGSTYVDVLQERNLRWWRDRIASVREALIVSVS